MPVSPNDMTAYRKKKKRRGLLYKLLAAGLFITGALIIILNAEEIFEPLRGIASKIDKTTSDTEGFPVELPGSADYRLGNFADGFYLLTDTYLYTYNANGKQSFALQHGYSKPLCRATDRRVLLYDHNSHEFSLYNKTSKIYQVSLDEKIISAELSDDDSAAVISTSPLYSNLLRIYDGNGKLRYTRRFVDEQINGVCFSKNNSTINVITSGIKNGDIISSVYRIRTDIEEGVIWKKELPANSWALKANDSGSAVIVLCDNLLTSLDSETGEITGSYSFSTGVLQKPVLGASANLLLLRDEVNGQNMLTVLDNLSEPLAAKNMSYNLTQVEIYGEMVYTLEGGFLKCYDRYLNETASWELEEEYSDFIKLGNEILLLGYDKVSNLTLN